MLDSKQVHPVAVGQTLPLAPHSVLCQALDLQTQANILDLRFAALCPKLTITHITTLMRSREDRYIGTADVPLTDGCLRSASPRRICLERSRYSIPLGDCRTASGSGGLENRFDVFKAKVADAFRKAASRRNISLGRVGETMCEDEATSTSMRDEEGAMYGIQQ
jgi:hypothetical protein